MHTKFLNPVVLSSGAAWIGRALTAFAQLFVVRYIISLIGSDAYGVVVIIAGLQGWFNLSDFGGPFSLLNYTSECRAHKEDPRPFIFVSFLYSLITTLTFVLCFLFISKYIAHFLFKNVDGVSEAYQLLCFQVGGVLLIVTANAVQIYKIWLSEDKGWLANIIPGLSALTTLALVFVPYLWRFEDIDVFYITLCVFLPNAFFPIIFYAYKLYKDKILQEHLHLSTIKKFSKRSLMAFIFSLQSVCTLQVDYIILSQFSNTGDILVYFLCSKMFNIINFLYVSIYNNMWPYITGYIAKKDVVNVKKSILTMLFIGITVVLCADFLLYFFTGYVFKFLSPHKTINPSGNILLLFCILQFIIMYVNVFSTVLQAASKLKLFIFGGPVQLVISAASQYYLGRIYGVIGVISGVMIGYMVAAVIPLPYFVFRMVRSWKCSSIELR